MSNICFIPARNSSSRLKNKNIASFRDGNLVTNTIEQALKSNIFDRIILSSNDKKILDMGKKYDIELYLREDRFDQIIGVMQNEIPKMNIKDDDTIGLLLVTCPLRSIDDIILSYKLFIKNEKYHPVVSVKKNENPIQMAFNIDVGGHLIPVMPDDFYRSTRKQDHSDTFFYNDAIIFDTAKKFMQIGRTLYGDKPIPYLMPWERSIAIDYEFQLRIVQLLGDKKNDEI